MEILTVNQAAEVKIKVSTATRAAFLFDSTGGEESFWEKDAAMQRLKAKTPGRWELCPRLSPHHTGIDNKVCDIQTCKNWKLHINIMAY